VIVGSVNARLEAVLQLQIEDSSGQLHMIEVVIDTGFTGDLTLRSAQLSALGLPPTGGIIAQLADGSIQSTTVHDAIMMWDDNPVQVGVRAVETDPLLGTRLLAGYELKIVFVVGGAVTLVAIP
jgi:clan AA aspartic protease